jgi:hypothetical protein
LERHEKDKLQLRDNSVHKLSDDNCSVTSISRSSSILLSLFLYFGVKRAIISLGGKKDLRRFEELRRW